MPHLQLTGVVEVEEVALEVVQVVVVVEVVDNQSQHKVLGIHLI